MLKKIAAALSILLVAMGIVAVTAVSASAHHNTISASVTCTADSQYLVTWKIENSEKWVETITASSDTNLVKVNDTFGNKEIKYPTEVMAVPTGKTLTLSAKWWNEDAKQWVYNTNSGHLTIGQFPDCTPTPGTVVLCHSTSLDVWATETVNRDTLISSAHHTTDAADIIPSFTYWAQVNGAWTQQTYAGKNLDAYGTQLLAAGCDKTKIPTTPDFAPAQCTGPGTWSDGSYTIPAQSAVTYQVRLTPQGGTPGEWETKTAGTYFVSVGTFIEVSATGLPTWVSPDGTKSWTYTVESPGACLEEVEPVKPGVTPIAKCETEGFLTFDTKPGVIYTLTFGDGKRSAFIVTATPATGYTFPGGVASIEFADTLGDYTKCATATPPTFVPSECSGPGAETGGTYTIPVSTNITYQVKIGDGDFETVEDDTYTVTAFPTSIVVKAVPNDGYSLKDYTGDWPYLFESAGDCLTESDDPVTPTFVLITECGKYGSLTMPTTTGVVYTLTEGDGLQGAWKVTATPEKGYYFTGAQSVDFTGNLGKFTTCVYSLTVGLADSECVLGDPVSGYFSIPEKTGVQFSANINGAGFVDFGVGDHEVPNGAVVSIVATALPGFTIVGTAQWDYTFGDAPFCPPTLGLAVPSYSSTPITCTAPGSFTVGGLINAEHVVWTIVTDATTKATSTPLPFGTYQVADSQTITLVASSDDPVRFGLADSNSDAWVNPVVLTFSKPNTALCGELTTLALTGSVVTSTGLALAAGLVLMGLGGILAYRRRVAE